MRFACPDIRIVLMALWKYSTHLVKCNGPFSELNLLVFVILFIHGIPSSIPDGPKGGLITGEGERR